jgi:hypothetical protein
LLKLLPAQSKPGISHKKTTLGMLHLQPLAVGTPHLPLVTRTCNGKFFFPFPMERRMRRLKQKTKIQNTTKKQTENKKKETMKMNLADEVFTRKGASHVSSSQSSVSPSLLQS